MLVGDTVSITSRYVTSTIHSYITVLHLGFKCTIVFSLNSSNSLTSKDTNSRVFYSAWRSLYVAHQFPDGWWEEQFIENWYY